MPSQLQTQSPSLRSQEPKSFGEKIGECFKMMLSCCGAQDEDDDGPKKALVISSPTDFRREEINIPGLSPEQERFVREKAQRDAEQLYARLQPLHSSPSGTFAERPPTANPPSFVTYEQFTQPRSAPSPHSSRIDRVMAHGRKLSDTFRQSLSPTSAGHYHAVESRQEADNVEMRALMDPSKSAVGSPRLGGGGGCGEMSEDSLSRTTVTEESSEDLDAKRAVDAKI